MKQRMLTIFMQLLSLSLMAQFGASSNETYFRFDAQWQGETTKISWNNFGQPNVLYYQLERKMTGDQSFTVLSTKKVDPKNPQTQYFEVMDDDISLSGIYQYRLGRMLKSGYMDLNLIQPVEITHLDNIVSSSLIHSGQAIQLDMSLSEETEVSYRILNQYGEVVKNGAISGGLSKGSAIKNIDIEDLMAGSYVLRTDVNGLTDNFRFTKM